MQDINGIMSPDPKQPETEADIRKLLHELRGHQVELKLQNDELSRAGEEIRFLLAEFTDLYNFAPLGYLTVGTDGIIQRCNLAATTMLDTVSSRLPGQPLRRFVDKSSRRGFDTLMGHLEAAGDGHAKSGEIILRRNAKPPVHAQINALFVKQQQIFRVTLTDISSLKKLEAERDRQALRIRGLSHRLVAIQEAERRTLGTELHDRTSGNLAALDLLVRDLAEQLPEPLAGRLAPRIEDIRALLLETTCSIRDISSSIRPAILDHAGLIPALEEYTAKFAKIHNIKVELKTTLNRQIDPELGAAIFRIVQEALTNCAKHSHASTVRIALSSPASKIALSVADDGHGFLPESLFGPGAEPGLGILSMKERAEFLGGQFTLKSTPGKGTRIQFDVRRTKEQQMQERRSGDRRAPLPPPAE